jgi:hypothetical protein
MKIPSREVMALVFEFVLSLVVSVGGGLLIYTNHDVTFAISAIDLVLSFWFIRRTTESLKAAKTGGDTTPSKSSSVAQTVQTAVADTEAAVKQAETVDPQLVSQVVAALKALDKTGYIGGTKDGNGA